MSVDTAGQIKDELEKCVEQIVQRLDEVGDVHWSAWMEKCLGELRSGEIRGVSRFLDAFGGMGSFNDAYPHDIQNVVTRAYTLASELLRDFRS
ncbi:MAG: hypothetical protein GY947_19290 [Rhodobacteraceae bacterium]|nr:hypothetical protein [Paracoccaceae bacterium]